MFIRKIHWKGPGNGSAELTWLYNISNPGPLPGLPAHEKVWQRFIQGNSFLIYIYDKPTAVAFALKFPYNKD